MATFAELARMAENAYSGTASATQSSQLRTFGEQHVQALGQVGA